MVMTSQWGPESLITITTTSHTVTNRTACRLLGNQKTARRKPS